MKSPFRHSASTLQPLVVSNPILAESTPVQIRINISYRVGVINHTGGKGFCEWVEAYV